MDSLWKHHSKIDWRISPWIFSLLFFGNNSGHRIIVLVWMTGSLEYAGNCCGFDHMFSLLKRCKYSLYSDTMLNYWISFVILRNTTHTWRISYRLSKDDRFFFLSVSMHSSAGRNVEQTKYVLCTLKNIYSSRCSHIAVHGWSELNSIGRMLIYIHSQQRNEICENYS